MATYSFKHVGRTQETVEQETLSTTTLPIGIKTPLRLGVDDLFEMHTEMIDVVADNFRNLVLCNWGERLGTFDFGADLRPLLSDRSSSDDFDGEAMQRISRAVEKWMPYIDLESFQSNVDRTDNRTLTPIQIRITYNVPALNVTKRSLELTLYAL